MSYNILAMLSLSVTLAVSGCAGLDNHATGARPDWIDATSSRYPREQYIIGRGQADGWATAQDRARADIAKTFQVNIHASSSDSQQLKQRTDESGSQSSMDTEISRHISTETDQIIDGVEIAEVWKNPDTGDYHALAILSRHQAITRLRQQIEQQDNATDKYIAASRDSKDTLTQAGFAARALAAQQQRAAYQKMATIVDLNGRGVTPRWETSRLEADLNDLLSRIRIHVVSTTTGETGQVLASMLAGALAAAGLTPGDENNSDYLLAGQVDINDLGLHDGWEWQRGSVQIQLTEKASGQLRGKQSWNNLKASALDSVTARQRLFARLEQRLKSEMRQTLIDMAIAN